MTIGSGGAMGKKAAGFLCAVGSLRNRCTAVEASLVLPLITGARGTLGNTEDAEVASELQSIDRLRSIYLWPGQQNKGGQP